MRFLQVEQHTIVASAVAGNNPVTPTMRNNLLVYRAAENLEMIGMVAIIGQDSCGRIATSEHDRKEECRSAPLQDALTCLLYSNATGNLPGKQQTKRRHDWVNAVDSFRRNQRHHDQAA